ncbi:MAG: hypothetical protein ABSC47_05330 [Terracidiphilus sp.]|jgi:hypothetical protein
MAQVGREAFLSHESELFDKLYANPASVIYCMVVWALITLTIFVLFKGIAFVAAKILSTIANKGGAERDNG